MIEKTPKTTPEGGQEPADQDEPIAGQSPGLDSNGDEYGSLSSSEMRELEIEATTGWEKVDARLRELGIID